MEDKELKCKLEEMAVGMGYEVKKKFKEQMDPIYKTFQTLIIFGFLTVFTIMGTYIAISFNKSPTIVYQEKIVYQDKFVVTEKIKYVDKPIYINKEKIVVKYKYKKRNKCNKINGMKLHHTSIKKGRKYYYYRNLEDSNMFEYLTVAYKLNKIKCQ